jgi:sensor histidine kinase YesM
MQALRGQMNPHFIFNSLSSINWFIMENDKDTASDYLTRFSRLMRMVLNAQRPMIPLEDELKMLQLYLDMERLRLEYSFDYSITFTNTIDAGSVSIPPMLLQPFCENAIWHGFRNKEGQGHININIRTEDHLLECVVTDNGIGRKQAAAFKKKSPKAEQSFGLDITRERLALFSEENDADADFEMEDVEDENGICKGTRVILKIAYKELIEEPA